MPSTPQLLHFEGGNALSDFRAQALLPRLQAISGRITAVKARYVHWVSSEAALDGAARDKLAALLTYGPKFESDAKAGGPVIVVMPRLGTVSPWASKATDIAHNCGLAGIHRIERVTEFQLVTGKGLLGGEKTLTPQELQACALELHDRMTENVALDRKSTRLNSSHLGISYAVF